MLGKLRHGKLEIFLCYILVSLSLRLLFPVLSILGGGQVRVYEDGEAYNKK